MNSRLRKISCIFACLLLIPLIVGGCWYYGEPSRRAERLIKGDTEIEVQTFRIHGQQLEIELTDPTTLKYLTASFRSAVKVGYFHDRSGGIVYSADLWLGFGAT